MEMTATEFLTYFHCEDYAVTKAGDELVCQLKNDIVGNKRFNTVFVTCENLVLPEVDDDVKQEIAEEMVGECTVEKLVDALTQFYNEYHETEDSEVIGASIFCSEVDPDNRSRVISHYTLLEQEYTEDAEKLMDKVYSFSNDDTLAYGYIEGYNKRASVLFTFLKPEPNRGGKHNYSEYTTHSELWDSASADYGSSYYHFNEPQLLQLMTEIQSIQKTLDN